MGRSQALDFAPAAASAQQRRLVLGLVGLAWLLLGACNREGKVLLGPWQTAVSRSGPQRLNFNPGGKARWEIGTGVTAQSFDLRYRLSTRTQPWSLDLSGFKSGPMAGAVMLCVVEMPSPDELALDCWPADPKNQAAQRPKALGPAALRLRRPAS